MPYVFCVDKTNLKKCLNSQLFGVPKSLRALSQIQNVHENDELFLYAYGEKKLYGFYKAVSEVFQEKNPEKGPWIGRKRDDKSKYYPYRLKINIDKDLEGISINDVEGLNIGIDRNFFNGKSVAFINETQAEKIKEILENTGERKEEIDFKEIEINPIDISIPSSISQREMLIQLIAQKKIHKLESNLKVLDTLSKVSGEYGYAGEIDILAKDNESNYVIIELKEGRAPKEIWSQIFSYDYIIWKRFAEIENVGIRSFLICKELEKKTIFAYKFLKNILENNLKSFKYDLINNEEINFEEIS